ncbi:hypothetical protein BDN70DRAFT_639421 [Pholiota conissans]|uniref:Uncharacterized protein n=1 Tax=Pholiota conissans TaxID=109636 RepID=A0A9P6D775_9AGAR|nr:hypothetical protein BDN70DRAFT_639421 [Pholiota conissans]
MLSGDLNGNSCDSESSTMEMYSASSTRILEQCGDQTEVETNIPYSNHDSIQIATTDLGTSQEHDKIDLGVCVRSDALTSPCQTSVHKFNAVEMANNSSFHKSGLSSSEVSLNHITHQDSELLYRKIILGSNSPGAKGNDSTRMVVDAPRSQHAHLLESLDDFDVSIPSAPYSLKPSQSDIEQESSSGSREEGFAPFSSSSSKFPLSPEISQRTDLESCEQTSFPSTESFKSTAGLSDDILSRSSLKGLNTETKSDGCGNPENHVCIPVCASLELPRANSRIGSDASEEDISTINRSLTFKDKLKQSHEETAISFVSDHSNVPLPSPPAFIEYSQSDPYFEPAIIFREHNP